MTFKTKSIYKEASVEVLAPVFVLRTLRQDCTATSLLCRLRCRRTGSTSEMFGLAHGNVSTSRDTFKSMRRFRGSDAYVQDVCSSQSVFNDAPHLPVEEARRLSFHLNTCYLRAPRKSTALKLKHLCRLAILIGTVKSRSNSKLVCTDGIYGAERYPMPSAVLLCWGFYLPRNTLTSKEEGRKIFSIISCSNRGIDSSAFSQCRQLSSFTHSDDNTKTIFTHECL